MCRLRSKPARSRGALARESSDSDCQTATPLCVIARSGSDEAIQSGISRLDCFARLSPSLAMTKPRTKATKEKSEGKRNAGRRSVAWSAPSGCGSRHGKAACPASPLRARSLAGVPPRHLRQRANAAAQLQYARPGAELLRSGRYPLPAAIQFTLLRSLARASEDLAGSPQAGRNAGRALTRSRPVPDDIRGQQFFPSIFSMLCVVSSRCSSPGIL